MESNGGERRRVKLLVFAASLRAKSLNGRLVGGRAAQRR